MKVQALLGYTHKIQIEDTEDINNYTMESFKLGSGKPDTREAAQNVNLSKRQQNASTGSGIMRPDMRYSTAFQERQQKLE